jgi:hypothetical protein
MSMKRMTGYDINDVLDLVGLARRRTILSSMLPAMGFLALGAAIGAGVGLMLAPSSGRRLRQDVGDRLDQIREKMRREAQQKREVMNATTPQQQQ